jgi:DNA-directed RNA polymerase specialized sigma24 family protein
VASTLLASLVRRGLSVDDAQDVVQEVLTRAIAYRSTFRSARAFNRWATVVARNLVYDRRKEEERLLLGDPPPSELPDPAEVVGERLFADSVLRAGSALSERDQQVIARAVRRLRPKDAADRKRFELRLHRARRRLLGRIEGWLGGVWMRWRWWAEEIAQTVVSAPGSAIVGAVAMVVGSASGATATGARTVPSTVVVTRPAPSPIEAAPVPGTAPERRVHDRPEPTPPTIPTPSPEAPSGDEFQRVAVHSPDGSWVDAGTSQNGPDQPLVCVFNIPRLGTTCVDLPG